MISKVLSDYPLCVKIMCSDFDFEKNKITIITSYLLLLKGDITSNPYVKKDKMHIFYSNGT